MDNIESSDFISDGFEGIGTRFSNISVVRETVHNVLARAQRYGQWWLLKGLKADEAGEPVFQEMLRKEFEMMIQFQHPHVVRAFSIEPVEGLGICIVMEWIEGDTLLHSPEGPEPGYEGKAGGRVARRPTLSSRERGGPPRPETRERDCDLQRQHREAD